ncbi:hypothetical protein DPMN_130662 [Dreissena polymorpha]|uniref:Uncharacterized protein n=1 Tax=Dreissena polymorpha TaxID=45954 RepID=A0A9D4JXR9_DREPO|nr:hypothetical protein DPMN_130662 [Dreissena polymorpha]
MNLAITGLCRHSPGLHLRTTCDNRGVAVALPGFVWAPVEQRCRPGCSRCRPGCFRCRAVRCRSFTVTTGSSRRYKHFNTYPVERRAPVVPGSSPSSPVHPGRAPVHLGRSRITHRGSTGIILRVGFKTVYAHFNVHRSIGNNLV